MIIWETTKFKIGFQYFYYMQIAIDRLEEGISYDYVIYMLTGINLQQISLSDLGLIHTRENTEIL